MNETEQNVLNNTPDPLAELFRKKCTEERNNRHTMPDREVQTCSPQN